MKCLDTDFLVAVLRGRGEAREKMAELDREGRQSTTAISAFELFFGAYRSGQPQTNVEKSKMLLGRLDILPLETNSAEKAGELLADLTNRGDPIDFRDAMIAGIAKTNGLPLVTRNRDHFSRVKELPLETW
jgi:tRNA(fMet)-specific endonuclease VapC